MHNNEVTYDNKWDTKKNKHYKDLAMEFANRGALPRDIPLSWAREVYFFFCKLDKEFGLRYDTNHYRSRTMPGFFTLLKMLFKNREEAKEVIKKKVYGTYYNLRYKPKVHVSQFKEKFGYVRIYYDAPEDIKPKIEKYIHNLEISLMRKGAYHSAVTLTKERKKEL